MGHRDTDDTNEHMFPFILPMSSIKSLLSANAAQSQRHFLKTWTNVKLDIFACKKRKIFLRIVCCEVFFLRAVLGYVGGGRFADLLRQERVYVFPFSLDQLSSACPATHNNKHSSNPAQSLGHIKPQEFSLRQPPSESGGYIGVHFFF